MATGTYTTGGNTATPGSNNSAVGALQKSLNAKGANLTVDNKYGPLTAAAYAKYGGSSGSGSNPASSSSSYRNDVSRTGADISGLSKAYKADYAMLQQQQALLAERRNNEIAGIKTAFDIASGEQAFQQKQDYGARATSLITSGGGFLGGTQSQQGVLQNLQHTFDTEKTALMAKREAAILAAQTAYEDKDFALAREMSANARDLQKEIYTRQKDYADQTLALSRENRAQTEFDMGVADKKIQAYASMDDATFNALPEDLRTETDKFYYNGYTTDARNMAKKALDMKTRKDEVGLDADILSMRLKVPAGQKFTLGGQTYTGLDSSSGGGGTEAERKVSMKRNIDTLLQPGYTIPGSSIPFIDNNGYITPEGFSEVIKFSGWSRKDFIDEYGYKLYKDNLDAYRLTKPEQDIILGKI